MGRLVSQRGPQGGSGYPNMPQNDSHDALIILDIHNWGKKKFQKKIAHQLSHGPTRRSGRELNFVLCFHPSLNSTQNSE